MDTDRSRPKLGTIEHHVIGQRTYGPRVGLEFVHVGLIRRRKGMMGGIPTALFIVILEHGKIRYPEEAKVVVDVSISLKSLMAIGVPAPQLKPRLARRGVLGFFASLRPALCAFGRRDRDHGNYQVFGCSAAHLANSGGDLRVLLFQLSEIVEDAREVSVSLRKLFSKRAKLFFLAVHQ